MEVPWTNGKSVLKDCYCSNRSLPMNFKSKINIVEVHFTVKSMNTLDDYNNLYFEGNWDFVKSTQCQENKRLRSASGEIKNQLNIENEDEVKFFLFYLFYILNLN